MNKNKKTRHDGRTVTVEGEEAKRRKAKEIATSKDNGGTRRKVIMSCVYTSGASRPPDKGEEGGSQKQIFLAPRASVWFKNKGEGRASRAPPLDPPLYTGFTHID